MSGGTWTSEIEVDIYKDSLDEYMIWHGKWWLQEAPCLNMIIQSDIMALTVQYYLPSLCCNTGMPLLVGLENVKSPTE